MSRTTHGSGSCVAASFDNLSVFGANIFSINAGPVTNFTLPIPEGIDIGVQNPPEVSFCNVTVTYTHPGQNDTINTETWLPLEDWNSRLQAVGGGGWVAGRDYLSYVRMLGIIADGYVTTTTDGGQGGWSGLDDWALVSQGNINILELQNLGLTSLNDTAAIAKSLSESYYGKATTYSYWNGCSQGGRQGLALAQRFPTAYDGIFAAAPASNWAELIAVALWPPAYMQFTDQYPLTCEIEKLTSLAISVCDELDNVKDGRIANPEACREAFDPKSYIDKTFSCKETGETIRISREAVSVASAIWDGPRFADGRFMWYGYDIGTNITRLTQSICSDDGTCQAADGASISQSMRYFVDRDSSSNVTKVTHEEFDHLYRAMKSLFASNLETNDADLTEFRDAGGKLVTYHGLVDSAIPPDATLHYYNEVEKTIGDVGNFYKYFRVPGLEHCWGGVTSPPSSMFSQLVKWTEGGDAPTKSPVTFFLPNNGTSEGVVCSYAKKARLSKECELDSATEECWSCSD